MCGHCEPTQKANFTQEWLSIRIPERNLNIAAPAASAVLKKASEKSYRWFWSSSPSSFSNSLGQHQELRSSQERWFPLPGVLSVQSCLCRGWKIVLAPKERKLWFIYGIWQICKIRCKCFTKWLKPWVLPFENKCVRTLHYSLNNVITAVSCQYKNIANMPLFTLFTNYVLKAIFLTASFLHFLSL